MIFFFPVQNTNNKMNPLTALSLSCCVLLTQRRIHKYTNNHHLIYTYVQISIGSLHSMSLPCDATAGSADRGQKVISFSTVYRTRVGFIRSNGEKKKFH